LIDGGDASYTREMAAELLGDVTLTFRLDGEPLSVSRTTLKRYVAPEVFELEEAYWVQEGAVLAPQDLGVGEHELAVDIAFPDGSDSLEVTFFVDAAGTGVCL
jgi:hypothetical protein